MFPLLATVFDFNATPAMYDMYDKMSARELFRRCASTAIVPFVD